MKDPNKHLFKAAVIIILTVVLLVPSFYIGHLVEERKSRKNEIVQQIANSWSKAQNISSPFLIMNYTTQNGVTQKLFVNPDVNSSTTQVVADTKKRGIYKVPVYTAAHQSQTTFNPSMFEKVKANYATIDFSTTKIAIAITDAKGIMDTLTASINGQNVLLTVDESLSIDTQKILTGNIPPQTINETATLLANVNLKLRGTEKLSFLPLATQNNIKLTAPWQDPAFFGNTISDNKVINKNGFVTNWQINRFQTQVPAMSLILPKYKDAVIGVNFIQPVDAYTKTMRITKYALLLIALTFAFYFFIEAVKNTPIHPIQYGLVGLAIVLFFTLLLSISEYLGFDPAYVIAALATIVLISWYTKVVTFNKNAAFSIAAVLIGVYTFIYFIIQLEDTSLLIGSIGLFIILGLIMHMSRKVKWYQPKVTPSIQPNLNE
jgi:inner membrane protein